MSKKPNPSTKASRSARKGKTGGVSDGRMAIILFCFGFMLYANTLEHGYAMDDVLAIGSNQHVQKGIGGIFEIFSQPYREQCFGGCLYRPLTLTTFAIEWSLSPNNPFLGHFMNVLWYAVTVVLLFLTLRKLLPGSSPVFPVVACLLFAAHPVHTEVVANIKSRDEILGLFFALLAVHQYAAWYKTSRGKFMLFAALSFLAALLSKESSITALAIFPFIGWLFFQKSFGQSVKSSWWVLIPLGIFFLLRGTALYGFTAPDIPEFDNPLVIAHGTERVGTAFFILWKYLLLLLFPVRLICDYSYNALPLHSLASPVSWIGIIAYAALTGYAVVGMIKKNVDGFFAFAYLAAISLYSQLIMLLGTMMSERLLYLPSLWFILGLTFVLTSGFQRESQVLSFSSSWKTFPAVQRIILLALAAFTTWFSVHTIIRNRDWSSDYTLVKADVEKSPNSIRLNDGYADEIYKTVVKGDLSPEEVNKRLALAEQYVNKSLAIRPGISSYTNMANICVARNDFPKALSCYQKISEISVDKKVADRNIASFLMYWAKEENEKKNNPAHALELLKQALPYAPDNGEIWRGMALNDYRLGNFSEALTDLEKAYQLAPDNASIKSDLINLYRLRGMNDKADALQ